ncbi:kinase [Psychrobacillus sp. FSL W7-1493]|uniref:kinase n=1 Tax=Psychrobacillus sp. FSL W7-1493 TaxID=2921552 RepID=UPI0030F8BCFA
MFNVQQILTKIKSLNRPFVLGVDGLSGAGKTTFTDQLAQELEEAGHKIVIIHLDDLIEVREKRYNTGQPEWYEYYSMQWDVLYIQESLFKSNHEKAKVLQLKFYIAQEDQCLSKDIPLKDCTVLLIEGVFLQRKEWRSFVDYLIYLDCPREIRNVRVLKRDSYIGDMEARLNKYERRYWKGEEFYLREEKPLEQADLVLDVENASIIKNVQQ